MSFKSTDKLQVVFPYWKWSIKVHITLCPEMHSFDDRWLCRTSNKEPWHTVHGLNLINVTTDVGSSLHGTHVHTNADKWRHMLCDWVVLPVRVRGSVHSCCLSTVSTCLTIHQGRPNYGPRALSDPPTPFLRPISVE